MGQVDWLVNLGFISMDKWMDNLTNEKYSFYFKKTIMKNGKENEQRSMPPMVSDAMQEIYR